MDRRAFITGLGAVLAAPLAADAQQVKTPRIGYLGISSPTAPSVNAFRQAMRELGYVERSSVIIDYRFAEGQSDRLPRLTEELLRLPVDILVTSGPEAAKVAQRATHEIPIVVAVMHEPIFYKLVASFARPGGNLTGLAFQESELVTKQLQLLHEGFPRASKVAVLYDPNAGGPSPLKATEAAARTLGQTIQIFEVRSVAELPQAFQAASQAQAQALLQLASPLFGANSNRVGELAAKQRIPSMCEQRALTEAGCLMSYGPNFQEMFRRAATYVDRIIKGAKPGDLPIEQASTFELVINLKTAKALGLTIPPSLLLRADQVIE